MGKISRALQTNKKYSFNSNRLCVYTKKKYCWFNLENEVTWLPYNFTFIEMEKLS